MKISEYIAQLAKIMSEHGDLPCYTVEGDCDEWCESLGPSVNPAENPENAFGHLPKRVLL